MEKIHVFIFCEDREYSKALGVFLTQYKQYFTVEVFNETNLKSENFKEEGVYIIEETLIEKVPNWAKDTSDRGIKHDILYLTLDKGKEENRAGPQTYLFKFRKAEWIAKEILFIWGKEGYQSKSVLDGNETNITGLFSCAGGVGQTTAAWVLGHYLCEQKKVLYLNWEELPSTRGFCPEMTSSRHNIADFLYFVLEKKQPINSLFMESYLFKAKENLWSIYPNKGLNQLLLLTKEEIEIFLNELINLKKFDHIIIDFPNSSWKEFSVLLECCHQLIFIESNTLSCEVKKENMFTYLIKEPEHLRKIKTIKAEYNADKDKYVSSLSHSISLIFETIE